MHYNMLKQAPKYDGNRPGKEVMGALKETLKKIKQARRGYDDDRGRAEDKIRNFLKFEII